MRHMHPALLGALFASLLAVAPPAFGSLLPDGDWVGTGSWESPDGASGRYEVRLVIQDDRIDTTYSYDDRGGRSETHTLRLVPREGAFVDIENLDGDRVGSGFCRQGECLWRATYTGATVNETLSFDEDALHRFGSKQAGDRFRVVWSESLSRE